MAEIKKGEGGSTYILLTLEHSFIRRYGLQNIINHDDRYTYLTMPDFDKPGHIKYIFLFPPFYRYYPEDYLEVFLENVKILLPEPVDKRHIDNLLFLAYTYSISSYKKSQDKRERNRAIEKGKLLLSLLKIPRVSVNKENVYNLISDEHELLAYLSFLSSKSEDYFLNENEGKLEIAYEKITGALWKELTAKLNVDKGINISLENDNNLLISPNVKLKFHAKFASDFNPISVDDEQQNEIFFRIIIQSIITEQKNFNPSFYNALLEHDFINSRDFDKLSAILTVNEKSNHIYNLKTLHDYVKHYLVEEKIFAYDQDAETDDVVTDMIYRYFIMLGILLKGKKPNPHESVNDLLRAINILKNQKVSIARGYFRNNFKKLEPAVKRKRLK